MAGQKEEPELVSINADWGVRATVKTVGTCGKRIPPWRALGGSGRGAEAETG